jgi:cytochrome c
MKYPILLSAAALLAIAASAPSQAQDTQGLLQSNGCSACHAQAQKVVGPAWGWIAYRYQGKKDAVKSVADFIINGGVGYWKPWTGGVPMPSHPNLSKAQAEQIAKWVLAQPAVKPPAQ